MFRNNEVVSYKIRNEIPGNYEVTFETIVRLQI